MRVRRSQRFRTENSPGLRQLSHSNRARHQFIQEECDRREGLHGPLPRKLGMGCPRKVRRVFDEIQHEAELHESIQHSGLPGKPCIRSPVAQNVPTIQPFTIEQSRIALEVIHGTASMMGHEEIVNNPLLHQDKALSQAVESSFRRALILEIDKHLVDAIVLLCHFRENGSLFQQDQWNSNATQSEFGEKPRVQMLMDQWTSNNARGGSSYLFSRSRRLCKAQKQSSFQHRSIWKKYALPRISH